MVITSGEDTYYGVNYKSSERSLRNETSIGNFGLQSCVPQPEIISKRSLNRKIRSAASEIGIDHLIILSWKPGTINTIGTRGVVRQAEHGRIKEPNQHYDLGYFKAVYSTNIRKLERYDSSAPFTVESFIINPWPFSDEKVIDFIYSLSYHGLKAETNCPFGSKIIHSLKDQREWNERTILYLSATDYQQITPKPF